MAKQETPLGLGSLPPGTQVGSWYVEKVLGQGAYGIVYGAESLEPGVAGCFALKVATRPQDPRFAREVALMHATGG